MDTADEPSDDHEQHKQDDGCDGAPPQKGRFDAGVKLHCRRRHDGQDKQRRGRRIGDLKSSVDQRRTVIDGDLLKEQICRDHGKIKTAEEENIGIHAQGRAAADPLAQTEDRKAKADGDGNESQPIRDGVKGLTDTCQRMNIAVERGKSDT